MTEVLLWLAFIVFVMGMLAIDLGVFHKSARVISSREALRWSGFCMFLALLFTGVIYWLYEQKIFGASSTASGLQIHPDNGADAAMQFFTGWLVEQSLSIDNIFVIAIIFSFFRVPLQFQHRVLLWGILGALIMRGIMIALGGFLIAQFSWINYVFGALLLYAAIKLLTVKDEHFDPSHNILYRLARRLYPVTPDFDGEKFFTVKDGRRMMTPLFLVLLVIESTDLLFAVDSIPAVFALTHDPFIVFTSNVFAILNLRSLYFALAALIARFAYLKTSLVFVLLFIALKMMLGHVIKIPTVISLLVIVAMIATGVIASWIKPKKVSTVG